MATTSPDNIWTPDAGDEYALTTDLAATADTIQDAFTGLRSSGALRLRGLASAIPAAGVEGRTYYATDTNREWFDDGSNWITNDGGMFLVRPTSVSGSGVTISPEGFVQLSSTPSGAGVNIEGVFTSQFRNYSLRAVFTSKPSSASNVQGLVGSSAVTSSLYSWSRQAFVGGARLDAQGVTQTNFGGAFIPEQGSLGSGTAEILSPNLAEATYILATTGHLGGFAGTGTSSAALNSSDQLTGIRLNLGTGSTWSGRISIYGLK